MSRILFLSKKRGVLTNVPEAPGLEIELNDEVVNKRPDPENPNYFAPTPDWDKDRS